MSQLSMGLPSSVCASIIPRYATTRIPETAGPAPRKGGPGRPRHLADRLREPQADQLVVIRRAAAQMATDAEREVVVVEHRHLPAAFDHDVLDRHERERERVAQADVAGTGRE